MLILHVCFGVLVAFLFVIGSLRGIKSQKIHGRFQDGAKGYFILIPLVLFLWLVAAIGMIAVLP